MGLSINDSMSQKLRLQGKTKTVNDMLKHDSYWRTLAGGSTKSINQLKKDYLRGLGYTGSLNEMEKKYWELV